MPLNTGGGAGGNAGGIRAGSAFIEIFGKDRLTGLLDKLRGKFAGFGSAFAKGGAAGLAAGTAVLAPIVGLAAAGAERFDRMAQEAIKLNVPIEQYYRLARAAEIAGVSIEQIADNPRQYAGLLNEGGAVPVREIKAAVEASREWRRTWMALQDAAAGLAADLMPVIRAVGQFVRENSGAVATAAAVGAGLVALGTAAVGASAALNVLGVGVAVAKAVLVGAIAAVQGVIVGVTLLKTILFGTVPVMAIVGAAWAALKAVFVGGAAAAVAGIAGLKAVLLALLSPMGLVTVALVALGAAFVAHEFTAGPGVVAAFGRALATLRGAITEVGTLFGEMWTGIIAAVKQGDFESAFKVFAAGVKAIFFTMISALARAFSDFLRDVHGRLVALATVLAAIRGATLGGRLGPVGALVGAVGGGLAGGLAADAAMARLEDGLGSVADRFADLARDAAADLRGLNAAVAARTGPAAAAASLAGVRQIGPEMMARARGVFGGPLGQQLGAGDQFQRRLLTETQQINQNLEAIRAVLAAAGAPVFV